MYSNDGGEMESERWICIGGTEEKNVFFFSYWKDFII